MKDTNFKKGDLVHVHTDVGVVVAMEYEKNTPEGHLGIWFGEKDEAGIPLVKTVPMEYCKIISSFRSYH